MAWVSLCDVSELEDGKGKYVSIDGFRLAVFKNGESFHAFDDECPHAGGSLADGHLENECVICPLHFWAFKLDDGELLDTGGFQTRVYPVRVHEADGKQLVQADLPTP